MPLCETSSACARRTIWFYIITLRHFSRAGARPCPSGKPSFCLKHKQAFYSHRYDFFSFFLHVSCLLFWVHISQSEINLVNPTRWNAANAYCFWRMRFWWAKLVSWLIPRCCIPTCSLLPRHPQTYFDRTNNILIIATRTETLLTVEKGKRDKRATPRRWSCIDRR